MNNKELAISLVEGKSTLVNIMDIRKSHPNLLMVLKSIFNDKPHEGIVFAETSFKTGSDLNVAEKALETLFKYKTFGGLTETKQFEINEKLLKAWDSLKSSGDFKGELADASIDPDMFVFYSYGDFLDKVINSCSGDLKNGLKEANKIADEYFDSYGKV